MNVEHLLNVFTSLDTVPDVIWAACADFINHLDEHKPRFTVLGPKIEGLSDGHRSKPHCLFRLSGLFQSLGNAAEAKRLLTHTLELERGQGNDDWVARTLRCLVPANRMLGLYEEGIQRSREALEIYERLGDVEEQGKCWIHLGWLLFSYPRLDAAEEAADHALKIFLDQGREYWICDSHRLLGEIYRFKREKGKSIHHSEAALKIASSFDWHAQQFWIHHCLAYLYDGENKFGNAQAHTEQAKCHAVDNAYYLGRAMEQQAWLWYRQGRLEEAKAEALHARETFERLGATGDIGRCRDLLWKIE